MDVNILENGTKNIFSSYCKLEINSLSTEVRKL